MEEIMESGNNNGSEQQKKTTGQDIARWILFLPSGLVCSLLLLMVTQLFVANDSTNIINLAFTYFGPVCTACLSTVISAYVSPKRIIGAWISGVVWALFYTFMAGIAIASSMTLGYELSAYNIIELVLGIAVPMITAAIIARYKS
jgi:hypothetical protein